MTRDSHSIVVSDIAPPPPPTSEMQGQGCSEGVEATGQRLSSRAGQRGSGQVSGGRGSPPRPHLAHLLQDRAPLLPRAGQGVGVARPELPPRAGGEAPRSAPQEPPRPAAPPPMPPAAGSTWTLAMARGWTQAGHGLPSPWWDTGGIAEGPLSDGSSHERSQPVGSSSVKCPRTGASVRTEPRRACQGLGGEQVAATASRAPPEVMSQRGQDHRGSKEGGLRTPARTGRGPDPAPCGLRQHRGERAGRPRVHLPAASAPGSQLGRLAGLTQEKSLSSVTVTPGWPGEEQPCPFCPAGGPRGGL